MAARFPLILAATLLAGACNMADRSPRERERATREEPARADKGSDLWGNDAQTANAALPADQDGNAQLAAAPAATPRDALHRDWFAGSWTDDGDCSHAAQFNADGQYRLADGTRGMWNIRNGRLVVQNDSGRTEVQLRRTGADVVEIVNRDGSVGRSTRC